MSWNHRFDPGITVLVGHNASGKTNVLEAVYLLSSGNSFRAGKIEEMVHWDAEVGHVAGKIVDFSSMVKGQNSNIKSDKSSALADDDHTELRVTVTRGMVQGKRVAKRRFMVNGVGRRKSDFSAHLSCVLFQPDDLRLLTGSPSRRRGYLDDVLSQAHPEYARSLWQYEKALKQRNKLLDMIRDGTTNRSGLAFWNRLLVEHGDIMHRMRDTYVEYLHAHQHVFGGGRVQHTKSVLTEKKQLEYEYKEIASGYTLIGPHKDDFLVFDGERDLSIYGSRGEQRMTVLWLKMMQLSYLEKQRGSRPTLLLDDIFSELDDVHDQMAFDLAMKQQTIITATELPRTLGSGSVDVIHVGSG